MTQCNPMSLWPVLLANGKQAARYNAPWSQVIKLLLFITSTEMFKQMQQVIIDYWICHSVIGFLHINSFLTFCMAIGHGAVQTRPSLLILIYTSFGPDIYKSVIHLLTQLFFVIPKRNTEESIVSTLEYQIVCFYKPLVNVALPRNRTICIQLLTNGLFL